MEVISSGSQSRGSNVSGLTQRSWGGGWEVCPTNLENIAKLQRRTQPGKAPLGFPSPRDSPSTKLSQPELPQQNQRKATAKRPLPKMPKMPVSPMLSFRSAVICKEVTGDVPSTAEPTLCKGRVLQKAQAPSLPPREVLLSSSASQGMEKHPKVCEEQQGHRANPNACSPALITREWLPRHR